MGERLDGSFSDIPSETRDVLAELAFSTHALTPEFQSALQDAVLEDFIEREEGKK